jgi:transposase-like protein
MNPVAARKQIVQTYLNTRNYSETARRWHTSPQLVRNWVTNAINRIAKRDSPTNPEPPNTNPEKRLTPSNSSYSNSISRPTTDADTSPDVRAVRELPQQGISISPHPIRHLLQRHAPKRTTLHKQRRRFYARA